MISWILFGLTVVNINVGKADSQELVKYLDSKIEKVTVYPGYALVERVVVVPAQPESGDFVVAIGPLPMSAQPSSIQTQVSGDSIAIQGLEMRTRMSMVANQSKADQVSLQLKELRDQLIEAEATSLGIKLESEAIRNMASQESVNSLDPTSVMSMLALLRKEMTRVESDYERNQIVIKKIKAEIRDLELQVDGLSKGSGTVVREVRLNCYAQKTQASLVRLSYLVSGVNWEPSYDVRILPDLTGVNVNAMGQIRQSSGEDWKNVSLILSTAMPQIGLNPPSVPLRKVWSGIYRGPSDVVAGLATDAAVLEETVPPPPGSIGVAGGAGGKFGGRRGRSKAETFSAAPSVEVLDFGVTTQFVLPGAVDVADNDEAHRFAIRSIPLEVTPERYIVPSRSTNAYLRAEVKNTGDVVLLGGKAKIFLGPDYLGESSFPTMLTNDTTTLNLGIDPNLEVVFDTIEDYRDNPGGFSLSSTATITQRYRASLKLAPDAHGEVSVVLEESLPRSEDDGVEVDVIELSPAPQDDEEALALREEKGLYTWRFILNPGETKSVIWGYELSFDEELNPEIYEE